MSLAVACTAATLVSLAALLVAERAENRRALAVIKPLTSIGFLAVAVACGAMHSTYGCLIFVGLLAGFLGDVFLLSRGRAWFLAGLGVFLLGHVLYAVAFVFRGVDLTFTAIALLGSGLPAAIVLRWLRPHVDAPMRMPVYAYIVVISIMLALAVGTAVRTPGWMLLCGAVAFYASDISVARDRFVHGSFVNRLWGLPAYYVGQLLLAWTTVT